MPASPRVSPHPAADMVHIFTAQCASLKTMIRGARVPLRCCRLQDAPDSRCRTTSLSDGWLPCPCRGASSAVQGASRLCLPDVVALTCRYVPKWTVDAKPAGGVARFVNHSCAPNLFIQVCWCPDISLKSS